MQNILMRPWRRCFDFRGRSTRREYWLFVVQVPFCLVVLALLDSLVMRAFESSAVNIVTSLLLLAYVAFTTIASLAAAVRRVHDHDKTGWLLLIWFVPLLGWLFYLFLTLTPGTKGENSYGYDPREGDRPAIEDMAAVFA